MKALYYYNPLRRRGEVGGFYLMETCSDGHGGSGRPRGPSMELITCRGFNSSEER
jgi:hypothetical protein